MATDIGKLDTFPKLLMHHALVRGARPAIREKDLGIWQTWTWKEFADEVRFVACGLAGLGLARGEHFALVGDNRPRFYATMAAAQCLGAIPVPLYQDAVATEMASPSSIGAGLDGDHCHADHISSCRSDQDQSRPSRQDA